MITPEIKATLDASCGPPVDLHELGGQLGVVEVEWKELTVDGMVLPKADGYKIILNPNRARSRFSWAHELGHVIIQSGELASPQFRGRSASQKEIENLCDKLAAEILMPRDAFRHSMEEVGCRISSIPRLARTFDTSVQSTAIRFVEFLDTPAVLTVWKPSSNDPLRLQRAWSFQNQVCRPYRYGIPKGDRAKNVEVNGPYLALSRSGPVSTVEALFVTSRRRGAETNKWARFPSESMAIGSGQYRYVLSLSYVGENGRQPNSLGVEA